MNASESRRSFVQKYLVLPLGAFVAACRGRATNPTPPPTVAPTSAPPTPTIPIALAQPTSAPPTEPPMTETVEAPAATAAPTLTPTPSCADDDDEPTIAQTEGPYYTPNSPERTSFLEAGIAGTRMIVAGQVLTTACQPVARARVDFWHCDDGGFYDNEGFRLRGHQFTDDDGRYELETIMPGLYPGRTRHFHVKVQAPNQPILTTQLYFPDEPGNERDGLFDIALLMAITDTPEAKEGQFDFVLAI